MNAIKFIYLPFIAALLLASCASGVEEPELPVEESPICFRASLPEDASRAQIAGNDNLKEFKVTVFNPVDAAGAALAPYIDHMTVKKSDESDVFSSFQCQWPALPKGIDDVALTFFACHPAPSTPVNNTKITGTVPAFDYKLRDFTVAEDISRQVDFIAAYKSVSMKSEMNTDVQLDFEHRLSRIEVKAKGVNENCKIEIAGVLIGGTYSKATFDFKPQTGAGDWILGDEKRNVRYVYAPGDKIVTIDDKIVTIDDKTTSGVSIMGGTQGSSYAMLLPARYDGWDDANDKTNSNQGLYLGVLLRVIDIKGKQQYPYSDTNQGPDALSIPKVYMAVDGAGTVTSGQLYKGGNGGYYTDSELKTPYTVPQGSTVKEFGWSAIPVTGDWKSGYYYTYTLDYTYGMGLHAPDVKPSRGPNAGDPIISDKVGLTVSVKAWQKSSVSITVPSS